MAKVNFLDVVRFLQSILSGMSPIMKESISEFISKQEAKAKLTKNPFDDLLIIVIKLFLT